MSITKIDFRSFGDERLAVQLDGKIIAFTQYVGDDGYNYWAAIRFNADGSIDKSFGELGVAKTSVLGFTREIFVTSDGGILLVGGGTTNLSGVAGVTVVKLTADGTYDSSFGNGGISESYILGDSVYQSATVYSAKVLENGQILIFGASHTNDSWNAFAIKLNHNGTVDTGFGDNGKLVLDFFLPPGQIEAIFDAGEDENGNLYLYTQVSTSELIIKVNGDGVIDASYGDNGVLLLTSVGIGFEDLHDWVPMPDGSIFTAGLFFDGVFRQGVVLKLDSNGFLDQSFGESGLAYLQTASPDAEIMSICVQDDGKIIIGGYDYLEEAPRPSGFFLARFNADGSPDTGFGSGGIVVTNVRVGASDSITDIGVQADGKIVVSGSYWDGTEYNPILIRYNFDGSLDTTFNDNSYSALNSIPSHVISNGNVGGTITGTDDDDFIDAQGGNDRINAGAGNDTVIGGPGRDNVNAGNGDDTIVATIGDGSLDVYGGGTGIDTLDMSGITAPATVNLALFFVSSSQTGLDALTSVENVIGGSGNDTITGNGGVNRLEGQGGNDTINAGAGNDFVIGGLGNDTMNGGAGSDVFIFVPGFGNDRILQFDANPTGGQDLLDISAFGIKSADFAARVTIADVGADTLVTIDGNAAGTIRLVGIGSTSAVTQADFVLLLS